MARLTVDLVDWLGKRERTYEEVMCIWRSARSRLATWNKAIHRGFVMTEMVDETLHCEAYVTGADRERVRKRDQEETTMRISDVPDRRLERFGVGRGV